MAPLGVRDDPGITHDLAVEVLATLLGHPTVHLRIEFGGPVAYGYGVSAWDHHDHCYLIRLKLDCFSWRNLAHEMAHCVKDIKPGHVYDLDTDPHDKIREIASVDPKRAQREAEELARIELRANRCAPQILNELTKLAAAKGYDLV